MRGIEIEINRVRTRIVNVAESSAGKLNRQRLTDIFSCLSAPCGHILVVRIQTFIKDRSEFQCHRGLKQSVGRFAHPLGGIGNFPETFLITRTQTFFPEIQLFFVQSSVQDPEVEGFCIFENGPESGGFLFPFQSDRVKFPENGVADLPVAVIWTVLVKDGPRKPER